MNAIAEFLDAFEFMNDDLAAKAWVELGECNKSKVFKKGAELGPD